jgi:hypothetical protein
MSWTITPQTKVPVDPQFGSVSLLLHGDGTNGSTTITDNSPSPKTVTAVGNAQISTAQSKFGGASVRFDGTGDYLSVPVNSDLSFGTANFTIECWFYIAANSSPNADTNRIAELISSANGFSNNWELQVTGNSSVTGSGLLFSNTVAGTGGTISYTGTIIQSTWHHVAAVRSGTTTSIYFNGTSVASGTLANQTVNQVNPIWVGGLNLPSYNHNLNGYIDDLRITKGIARYTANFTPPAAPFPDI